MSQDSRKPQRGPIPRSPKEQMVPKKRKIFTRSNITKIFLPSLFLIAIILTPVLFEAFNTRHQRLDDIIEAPVPGNWYDDLFNNGAPSQDIDPDDNSTDGFMDGFTNGVSDPERILFRITPTDEYFYWRLEAYDQYLMDSWDKNITTTEISGYATHPAADDDGTFTVQTAELPYSGGTLAGNFPAPYHYQYNEVFADNTYFEPAINWTEEYTTLNEDMYGCKVIDAQFEQVSGNTTLYYDTYYTIQNNTDIKQGSEGFSSLSTLVAADSTLTDRYLQIPTDYSTFAPDTTQVAANLLNTSNTIFSQVYRNMFWLSNNCTYDLDMLLGLSTESPAPGEDYVEWFLDRRMGTAAHFAAALAVICRLQNIPSRIIVGFSSGDIEGSEFVIKAKHVHSWIEVFIPIGGTGYWVAFDPSPLIPGLREQFGVNTIGFETVFHCTNEFFISPLHMQQQSSYPYFVPEPTSTAWFSDPYNPGNWYGPYVNRSQSFFITAFLANGNDQDFFNYIRGQGSGDLEFIQGEQITFIDTTANIILGSAVTDAAGEATISYSYPVDADSGLHYIVAEWQGIQTPTYDLRYLPLSYVETGVIVTGSVNITSSNPYPNIGTLEVSNPLYSTNHFEITSTKAQFKNIVSIFQAIFFSSRDFI
ncbi:MAG: transglutaminase domain-containing protein [Asgard group archaeon]|nr:transglutaminase domain-containing protein [Asgard group archaeon]